jgi:REP element-mobilizing transposase RayT
MYFFAGARYDLLAYVVMPSHFHWLFRPLPNWVEQLGDTIRVRSPRERIMHSLKRYTARECNKILHAQGAFWQQESYDHWVREGDELERIIEYIEENPVNAKLARTPQMWAFFSAADRERMRIDVGMPPLVRLKT